MAVPPKGIQIFREILRTRQAPNKISEIVRRNISLNCRQQQPNSSDDKRDKSLYVYSKLESKSGTKTQLPQNETKNCESILEQYQYWGTEQNSKVKDKSEQSNMNIRNIMHENVHGMKIGVKRLCQSTKQNPNKLLKRLYSQKNVTRKPAIILRLREPNLSSIYESAFGRIDANKDRSYNLRTTKTSSVLNKQFKLLNSTDLLRRIKRSYFLAKLNFRLKVTSSIQNHKINALYMSRQVKAFLYNLVNITSISSHTNDKYIGKFKNDVINHDSSNAYNFHSCYKAVHARDIKRRKNPILLNIPYPDNSLFSRNIGIDSFYLSDYLYSTKPVTSLAESKFSLAANCSNSNKSRYFNKTIRTASSSSKRKKGFERNQRDFGKKNSVNKRKKYIVRQKNKQLPKKVSNHLLETYIQNKMKAESMENKEMLKPPEIHPLPSAPFKLSTGKQNEKHIKSQLEEQVPQEIVSKIPEFTSKNTADIDLYPVLHHYHKVKVALSQKLFPDIIFDQSDLRPKIDGEQRKEEIKNVSASEETTNSTAAKPDKNLSQSLNSVTDLHKVLRETSKVNIPLGSKLISPNPELSKTTNNFEKKVKIIFSPRLSDFNNDNKTVLDNTFINLLKPRTPSVEKSFPKKEDMKPTTTVNELIENVKPQINSQLSHNIDSNIEAIVTPAKPRLKIHVEGANKRYSKSNEQLMISNNPVAKSTAVESNSNSLIQRPAPVISKTIKSSVDARVIRITIPKTFGNKKQPQKSKILIKLSTTKLPEADKSKMKDNVKISGTTNNNQRNFSSKFSEQSLCNGNNLNDVPKKAICTEAPKELSKLPKSFANVSLESDRKCNAAPKNAHAEQGDNCNNLPEVPKRSKLPKSEPTNDIDLAYINDVANCNCMSNSCYQCLNDDPHSNNTMQNVPDSFEDIELQCKQSYDSINHFTNLLNMITSEPPKNVIYSSEVNSKLSDEESKLSTYFLPESSNISIAAKTLMDMSTKEVSPSDYLNELFGYQASKFDDSNSKNSTSPDTKKPQTKENEEKSKFGANIPKSFRNTTNSIIEHESKTTSDDLQSVSNRSKLPDGSQSAKPLQPSNLLIKEKVNYSRLAVNNIMTSETTLNAIKASRQAGRIIRDNHNKLYNEKGVNTLKNKVVDNASVKVRSNNAHAQNNIKPSKRCSHSSGDSGTYCCRRGHLPLGGSSGSDGSGKPKKPDIINLIRNKKQRTRNRKFRKHLPIQIPAVEHSGSPPYVITFSVALDSTGEHSLIDDNKKTWRLAADTDRERKQNVNLEYIVNVSRNGNNVDDDSIIRTTPDLINAIEDQDHHSDMHVPADNVIRTSDILAMDNLIVDEATDNYFSLSAMSHENELKQAIDKGIDSLIDLQAPTGKSVDYARHVFIEPIESSTDETLMLQSSDFTQSDLNKENTMFTETDEGLNIASEYNSNPMNAELMESDQISMLDTNAAANVVPQQNENLVKEASSRSNEESLGISSESDFNPLNTEFIIPSESFSNPMKAEIMELDPITLSKIGTNVIPTPSEEIENYITQNDLYINTETLDISSNAYINRVKVELNQSIPEPEPVLNVESTNTDVSEYNESSVKAGVTYINTETLELCSEPVKAIDDNLTKAKLEDIVSEAIFNISAASLRSETPILHINTETLDIFAEDYLNLIKLEQQNNDPEASLHLDESTISAAASDIKKETVADVSSDVYSTPFKAELIDADVESLVNMESLRSVALAEQKEDTITVSDKDINKETVPISAEPYSNPLPTEIPIENIPHNTTNINRQDKISSKTPDHHLIKEEDLPISAECDAYIIMSEVTSDGMPAKGDKIQSINTEMDRDINKEKISDSGLYRSSNTGNTDKEMVNSSSFSNSNVMMVKNLETRIQEGDGTKPKILKTVLTVKDYDAKYPISSNQQFTNDKTTPANIKCVENNVEKDLPERTPDKNVNVVIKTEYVTDDLIKQNILPENVSAAISQPVSQNNEGINKSLVNEKGNSEILLNEGQNLAKDSVTSPESIPPFSISKIEIHPAKNASADTNSTQTVNNADEIGEIDIVVEFCSPSSNGAINKLTNDNNFKVYNSSNNTASKTDNEDGTNMTKRESELINNMASINDVNEDQYVIIEISADMENVSVTRNLDGAEKSQTTPPTVLKSGKDGSTKIKSKSILPESDTKASKNIDIEFNPSKMNTSDIYLVTKACENKLKAVQNNNMLEQNTTLDKHKYEVMKIDESIQKVSISLDHNEVQTDSISKPPETLQDNTKKANTDMILKDDVRSDIKGLVYPKTYVVEEDDTDDINNKLSLSLRDNISPKSDFAFDITSVKPLHETEEYLKFHKLTQTDRVLNLNQTNIYADKLLNKQKSNNKNKSNKKKEYTNKTNLSDNFPKSAISSGGQNTIQLTSLKSVGSSKDAGVTALALATTSTIQQKEADDILKVLVDNAIAGNSEKEDLFNKSLTALDMLKKGVSTTDLINKALTDANSQRQNSLNDVQHTNFNLDNQIFAALIPVNENGSVSKEDLHCSILYAGVKSSYLSDRIEEVFQLKSVYSPKVGPYLKPPFSSSGSGNRKTPNSLVDNNNTGANLPNTTGKLSAKDNVTKPVTTNFLNLLPTESYLTSKSSSLEDFHNFLFSSSDAKDSIKDDKDKKEKIVEGKKSSEKPRPKTVCWPCVNKMARPPPTPSFDHYKIKEKKGETKDKKSEKNEKDMKDKKGAKDKKDAKDNKDKKDKKIMKEATLASSTDKKEETSTVPQPAVPKKTKTVCWPCVTPPPLRHKLPSEKIDAAATKGTTSKDAKKDATEKKSNEKKSSSDSKFKTVEGLIMNDLISETVTNTSAPPIKSKPESNEIGDGMLVQTRKSAKDGLETKVIFQAPESGNIHSNKIINGSDAIYYKIEVSSAKMYPLPTEHESAKRYPFQNINSEQISLQSKSNSTDLQEKSETTTAELSPSVVLINEFSHKKLTPNIVNKQPVEYDKLSKYELPTSVEDTATTPDDLMELLSLPFRENDEPKTEKMKNEFQDTKTNESPDTVDPSLAFPLSQHSYKPVKSFHLKKRNVETKDHINISAEQNVAELVKVEEGENRVLVSKTSVTNEANIIDHLNVDNNSNVPLPAKTHYWPIIKSIRPTRLIFEKINKDIKTNRFAKQAEIKITTDATINQAISSTPLKGDDNVSPDRFIKNETEINESKGTNTNPSLEKKSNKSKKLDNKRHNPTMQSTRSITTQSILHNNNNVQAEQMSESMESSNTCSECNSENCEASYLRPSASDINEYVITPCPHCPVKFVPPSHAKLVIKSKMHPKVRKTTTGIPARNAKHSEELNKNQYDSSDLQILKPIAQIPSFPPGHTKANSPSGSFSMILPYRNVPPPPPPPPCERPIQTNQKIAGIPEISPVVPPSSTSKDMYTRKETSLKICIAEQPSKLIDTQPDIVCTVERTIDKVNPPAEQTPKFPPEGIPTVQNMPPAELMKEGDGTTENKVEPGNKVENEITRSMKVTKKSDDFVYPLNYTKSLDCMTTGQRQDCTEPKQVTEKKKWDECMSVHKESKRSEPPRELPTDKKEHITPCTVPADRCAACANLKATNFQIKAEPTGIKPATHTVEPTLNEAKQENLNRDENNLNATEATAAAAAPATTTAAPDEDKKQQPNEPVKKVGIFKRLLGRNKK